MKAKKRVLVCGVLSALMVSATVVNAEEITRNGSGDCVPSITLTEAQGTFSIVEGGPVMNPITPKKVSGTYTAQDINGYTKTQNVSKSLPSGQLHISKYAPTHYQSKSGKMAYYLNGSYYGSLQQDY